MPTEREVFRKYLKEHPDSKRILRKLAENGRLQTSDSLDPNEPLIVMCGPDPGGIIGSKRTECVKCKTLIWLSPSTQEMLLHHKGPAEILCRGCAMERARERAGESVQ